MLVLYTYIFILDFVIRKIIDLSLILGTQIT